MQTKALSLTAKLWKFALLGMLVFASACTGLLPPNLPVTGGSQATITVLPPFPTATQQIVAAATQPPVTATAQPTVVQAATAVAPTATTAPTRASGCSYQATFVADVTVPDYSNVAAGAGFTKTWRIRNDGSCAWGPGQALDRLAFAGGSLLGGPSAVAIPRVVQPGETVDLSVPLTAPGQAGVFVSRWLLMTTSGATVGVGANSSPLTAVIRVGPPPTATPVVDSPCTYRATFVGDVTVPDNTVIAPGSSFAKIWRVRNDGTCTWGKSNNPYVIDRLVFSGGDKLGAPDYVSLPGTGVVAPGATVDLAVPMKTPATEGIYHSEWRLGNSSGPQLGLGAKGEAALYAEVVVKVLDVPIPTSRVKLNFGPGETFTGFSVAITPDAPQGYVLRVMAGQQMFITASGGVKVGVLDARDQEMFVVKTPAADTWAVYIPANGSYTVVLYGNGSTNVTITIPPL